MTIRNFALTYPQLMNQALQLKRSEQEIVYLRKAYELAAQLFDGLHRAQNVPFICHLTRTASILLEEKQSIEVAAAGLVHAAYAVGYFKDQQHGRNTPEHRAEVRLDLGEEAESIVYEYDCFSWYSKENVQAHLDKLESYGNHEKEIILIRLANELEDYLDCGMAYRGPSSYAGKLAIYGSETIELARKLGYLQLADELKQVLELHLNAALPSVVLTNQQSSYQLPALKWLKKSYLERLQIRSKELIQKLTGVAETNGKD